MMTSKSLETNWNLYQGQELAQADELAISSGQYVVTHTRDIKDIYHLMHLRAKVFSEDFGRENIWPHLDYDRFDLQCIHLMVKHIESDQVIGTYRLNPGGPFGFYSETEFAMGPILALPDQKLELGRAAILKEHRNGITLDLLWRAIALTSKRLNARYLFGTSSVPTVDWQVEQALADYFMQQNAALNTDINPAPFRTLGTAQNAVGAQNLLVKELLPPLLRTYLQAGAKVSKRAAYDAEFKCIDFLTLLDLDELNPSFRRRYFRS
jgi:putative hemolysin